MSLMTRLACRVALICGVVSATAAGAQEMYDSSVPEPGAVLKAMPMPMSIKFSERIHLTNIRLVGADGKVWPADWPKTEDDVFDVEIRPAEPLPPGKYQIEWTAWVRQHYHSDGGVIVFEIAP